MGDRLLKLQMPFAHVKYDRAFIGKQDDPPMASENVFRASSQTDLLPEVDGIKYLLSSGMFCTSGRSVLNGTWDFGVFACL